MLQKECIAMLLAGGQGSRLGCLTRNIAKPAVSFCGKYRIIDFSLSNCANSNINTVGVLTQYKPFLLNSYIGMGSAWDLDNAFGGVHILPPYVGECQGSWYKGTANAIYQNIDFINYQNPEYVLIISGDHIYKMDYHSMLKFHKSLGSEVTISSIEVPWEDASRFGIMRVDQDRRIHQFFEKPSDPDSNLASMGIYIFDWPILRDALIEDENDRQSEHDFGKNVLPKLLAQGKKLYAYPFHGYWRDVGTLESYYNANMETLHGEDGLNLYDPEFKVFSNEEILAPQYIGPNAIIENSLISNGCTILGKISNSILASGVYVGKDSIVKDSILLPNSRVLEKSTLQKTILGEHAIVMGDCSIGEKSKGQPEQAGITVVQDNHVVLEGTVIEEGKNVYQAI